MASKGRRLGNLTSVTGVSTVTDLNLTRVSVTGVSTFSSNPVLVGGGASTGTSSQPLQVTGGSYFSSNIGIGTTNPISQVQIFNTAQRYITLTGDTGATRIMMGNRDSAGTSGPSVIESGNRNLSFGVGDSFDTGDGGNITRYLFIKDGGKIGIGTVNPVSNLDVQGTDGIGVDIRGRSSDGATQLRFRNYGGTSNNGYFYSSNASSTIGSSTNLAFDINGSQRIRIESDGDIRFDDGSMYYDASSNKLGIGTTMPFTALHLSGSASGDGIYLQDSNYNNATTQILQSGSTFLIDLRDGSNNGTLLIRGKAGGNPTSSAAVGINTTNANEGLHVRAKDGYSVPLLLTNGNDTNDNIQLRFYGAYTKSNLWSIGNRISQGGTGRSFHIYDNVSGATRFEITDNSSVAFFNNGNGVAGASGGDDGNVVHIQGSEACLRVGPYYAGNDRDMILMRAAGTDTYIRSNNERFHIYNNQGEIRFSTGTNQTDNLRMTIQAGGSVVVAGALSKGSGSFRIDHPLPGLSTTHHLVHSFIEGPRADLIYRGEVRLVSGIATIIMDEAVGLTTGTWELLCREPDVFVTNNEDWCPVRAGITSTGVLTIEAQHNDCNAKVNWLVIAERQDAHMISSETDWTDDNGRPILEPLKPIEVGIGSTSVGIGSTQ